MVLLVSNNGMIYGLVDIINKVAHDVLASHCGDRAQLNVIVVTSMFVRLVANADLL
jgi:hypothetical protein